MAYFQQQDPKRNLSSQVWLPQDPGQLLQPEDGSAEVSDSRQLVALFPRNGDQEGGFGGWPGCLWATEDYINAGVGLFRRSPSTIRVRECPVLSIRVRECVVPSFTVRGWQAGSAPFLPSSTPVILQRHHDRGMAPQSFSSLGDYVEIHTRTLSSSHPPACSPGELPPTPLPLQFLDCWWQQSRSNRTQLFNHPWEQLRLNVFSATIKDRIAIVPYRELTGPDGRMIRHIWSDTGDEREERMRGELREALVLHGLLKSRGFFNWF